MYPECMNRAVPGGPPSRKASAGQAGAPVFRLRETVAAVRSLLPGWPNTPIQMSKNQCVTGDASSTWKEYGNFIYIVNAQK